MLSPGKHENDAPQLDPAHRTTTGSKASNWMLARLAIPTSLQRFHPHLSEERLEPVVDVFQMTRKLRANRN